MNIKLLRKIQKAIMQEPEQFDMDYWFQTKEGVPNCGTTACIAGWALSLSQKKNPLQVAVTIDKNFGLFDYSGVRNLAAKVLEITIEQADNLFIKTHWPRDFRYAYRAAFTNGDMFIAADVAYHRINHFIATGE